MKSITLSILFTAIVVTVNAQTVSKEHALERAREFMTLSGRSSNRASQRGGATQSPILELIPSTQIVPTDSMPVNAEGQPQEAFYVVRPTQNQEGGYVIVSADERMSPILGYSSSTSFDADNMPCTLRAWLTHYASELRRIDTGEYSITEQKSDAENDLVLHSSEANQTAANAESLPIQTGSVEPLIKTSWGQHYPYNKFCPNPSNRSTPCVTGCVATALAQILYYYRHPLQGNGSYSYHSYKWNQDFSADFGSTTYDWDNMLLDYKNSNYTDNQADAVATLMYHCGVVSDMAYDYSESGSSALSVVRNSINHFGMDADAILKRGGTSWYNWHERILFELNHHNPVMYCASSHCFILDGYKTYLDSDTPYYHMNMGWDGQYSDDYYLLTGFPYLDQSTLDSHEMFAGFHPEDNLELPSIYLRFYEPSGRYWKEMNPVYVYKHNPTSTKQIKLDIRLTSSTSLNEERAEPRPGILRGVVIDQDGVETQLYDYELENTNQWNIAEIETQLTLAQLPVGRYRMEWRLYAPNETSTFNLCTSIYNDLIKIYEQEPKLTVVSSSVPQIIDAIDNQLTSSVRNDGVETYYGTIQMQLTNEKGTQATLTSGHLTLPAGQTANIDLSGAIYTLLGGPVTVTWIDNYLKQRLLDAEGSVAAIQVDTRPIWPKTAVWKLKPQYDGTYYNSGIFYGMILNDGELPFYGKKIAAVVVDDDDNILFEFDNNNTMFNEVLESKHGFNTSGNGNAIWFTGVNGHLPNGEYPVRIAVQQENSDAWALYRPNYQYENMTITLKLTDSEALLGNDDMGWTSFRRTAWDGTIHYKYVNVTVKGPGTATFDYRPLHQGMNRRTVFTGNTGRLRYECPEGCHVEIMLDGNIDVTQQVVNNRFDLSNVQADHAINITFVQDKGNANLSPLVQPTITDLSTLIAIHDGIAPMTFCYANADLNKNGCIDDQDIALVSDMILHNHNYEEALAAVNVQLHAGHPYVDMGLEAFPNLRWATCNLGAETGAEEGLHYAWAETYEKDDYDYHAGSYRWMEGADQTAITKYTAADGLTRVEDGDDPARQQWGGQWRMPTLAEMQALADECNLTIIDYNKTKYNGKKGHEYQAVNGNILFFPKNTLFTRDFYWFQNTYGFYWTADLDTDNRTCAYQMELKGSKKMQPSLSNRYSGLVIRPVFDVQ